MNVLVVNAGSSSLKFRLIDTDLERIEQATDRTLARGIIERIGGQALVSFSVPDRETYRSTAPVRDHRQALHLALAMLTEPPVGEAVISGLGEIAAVGHRVVHGGERFRSSVLVDDEVLRGIEDMIDLAPLHNPHNLKGIRAVGAVLGEGVPQAAVFDTAFHHTIPEHAYLYAIPYSLYRRHKVRRYGFHGLSHRFLAYRYRTLTGCTREETTIVTVHLGNGCSAAAIRAGESFDTSMGFTPLEGMVMGTRSGDIDPAVLDFIAAKEGLSLGEAMTLLNKQSGLLGISGLTHDMRDLVAEALEHGDRRARLAIEVFCYRARKYIGAFLAALGGARAVVFTGGIGENSAEVRQKICEGLDWIGLELDGGANFAAVGGYEGRITRPGSRLEAWVIPTDEELIIARDTVRLLLGKG
jgi:acetate kinase